MSGTCERGHGGLVAHRRGKARAFALRERQAQAHGVGHGQDVAEQDGGVQRVALQRLQRDFGGVVHVGGQAHEAAGLGARGAVFGQVAAGLAHQPHAGCGRWPGAGRRAGRCRFAGGRRRRCGLNSCPDCRRPTGASAGAGFNAERLRSGVARAAESAGPHRPLHLQAAVLHHLQAGGAGPGGGFVMPDAHLQPERRCADGNGLVGHGGHVV